MSSGMDSRNFTGEPVSKPGGASAEPEGAAELGEEIIRGDQNFDAAERYQGALREIAKWCTGENLADADTADDLANAEAALRIIQRIVAKALP